MFAHAILHQMEDLLSGLFDDQLQEFHIIDCRFDYEYEGGHINGATNLMTPEDVEKYFLDARQYILQPMFFASVGFAIPFRQLWNGEIVWKGFVFAIVMLFGKVNHPNLKFRIRVKRPRLLWD